MSKKKNKTKTENNKKNKKQCKLATFGDFLDMCERMENKQMDFKEFIEACVDSGYKVIMDPEKPGKITIVNSNNGY